MADSEEIVLPRWQPDDELSNCSICGTHFTFLISRRHHCRRCGRLVCATCSPHRITIPRQYIVRPPEERIWDEDAAYARSRSSTDAFEYLDNLGGGETVRVCNPCVPDPNYGPPPQHETATSPPPSRSRASTYAHDVRSPGTQPRGFARSDTDSELVHTQSHSVPLGFAFSGVSAQPSNGRRPGVETALQSMPQIHRMRPSISTPRSHSDDVVPPSRQRYRTPSNARRTPGFDPAALAPEYSLTEQRPRSRDTTKSSEEGECPVCGTREPPFGPDGTAADRERHVEECLSVHFAFSAGPSTRAVPGSSIDIPQRPDQSQSAHQHGTPGTPGAPSPSVRQRMLVYHATEKDCFDESGEPQECVICFEEFQPAVEMGRLECLCRFHRTCIREWWSTKGPGSCPTHQLHG